jgi:hypothetical protein
MTQPRLEVAEVFREHVDEYLAAYGATTAQRQILRAIQNCRTAALGGHVEACDHCDHQRIAYNSCRNRHCPKCQGPATARWLEARAAELLPVPYFHLVLTLPRSLGPVALRNPRVMYGLLLQAAAQSLLAVAADPQHLGAEIGFLAVLHTWGQNLLHHPHVHCVVPAGGISPDGVRWIPCRPGFFLPVRVLSRVFRGKFIQGLKQAFARNELTFPGALAELAAPRAFEQLLDQVVRHDWVVYAKRPFGGPEQVLKYLARYTHRVAISNERLIGLRNAQVTFRWKDYTQGGRQRRLTLAASEFIRRFLLHVLPTGFVKIRHYGFLANRFRSVRREQCRRLLNVPTPQCVSTDREPRDCSTDGDRESPLGRCPHCQQGRLRIVLRLAPQLPARRGSRSTETYFDTS